MKKVTLILSALALVLGLSQCKKQEEPAQSGEKQHIVLTANNGNDGSKVAASFASAALNLTWEGYETIAVSGGASGTLTYKSGVGTPNATFEGDITIDGGGDVVFTIGSAPSSYANQTGTADGCAAWINGNNHFVGTSQWQDDGNYNVTMKLQYAVLKLDVSALGTTGAMTIAANEATVASVTNVSGIASAVFVAVPTDETEKAYTITCGGKTATKTWTLEKNVFYTKAGAEGAGTGNAIVIEPDAPATPKFTVGMNGDTPITVEFAPGNLYWDGSAFRFEENQWDYSVGDSNYNEWGDIVWNWVQNHVSHFKWSDAEYAVTGDNNYNGNLFCDSDDFTVTGDSHTWRTLSRDEWNYLLNIRTNASSLRKWKDLGNNVKGLVILPDGTENPSTVMSSIYSTSDLATRGAVFLPAAGYRSGTYVNYVGSDCNYWSGTLYESNEMFAYNMYFNSSEEVSVDNGLHRGSGQAVRLVRNITE